MLLASSLATSRFATRRSRAAKFPARKPRNSLTNSRCLPLSRPFTEKGIEIRDAKELRVKESDRIGALAENLKRMGAQVEERPDGLRIEGKSAGKLHGAEIDPRGDHRIAMAFAVAALGADGATTIKDAECAAVSFPNFFEILAGLIER